ncbi:hypothetical protein DIJ64_12840 [Mycobacterium leprae]|uniref:Uncharacterized protein n=1 Tax=Mycobacterium leprae TaxID=1769 RepID=A0AAD0KXZ7_MYCLR|nr:hypothetical protein [Mycobacterium leprae]AWV48626.1 hypothetical protein DIJ64_12840 [Mycobacterium leprae]
MADYYFGLLVDIHSLRELTEQLQAGTLVHKKAKTFLWEEKLRMLPVYNPHVVLDLAKIRKGEQL